MCFRFLGGRGSCGMLLGCGERLEVHVEKSGVPSLTVASVANLVITYLILFGE
jgi:hypothetical protein